MSEVRTVTVFGVDGDSEEEMGFGENWKWI